MKNTLIDAGLIIALFDSSDRYHRRAQDRLLEWIERGGVEIHPITRAEVSRMRALTQQYVDVPMDLADASLVVVSELTGIEQILSIDRDFYVYRRSDGRVIENVFRHS